MSWVADPEVGRIEIVWVRAAAGDAPSARSETRNPMATSRRPMVRTRSDTPAACTFVVGA